MTRTSLLFILILFCSYCYGQALRDPTRPLNWSASDETPKNIELSAILTRSNQSMAVINDKIVKEGDLINGYHVIKIEPNIVHLQNSNGMFMIQLIDDQIITPVSNAKGQTAK